MNGYATYSIYRDEPIENVRTMIPEGGSIYYQCVVCGEKLYYATDEAVERFIERHEHCGEE